jgi:hypothetical protein
MTTEVHITLTPVHALSFSPSFLFPSSPPFFLQDDGGITTAPQLKPTGVPVTTSTSQLLSSSSSTARLARDLRATELRVLSPKTEGPSYHGTSSATPVSLRGLHFISQPAADLSPPIQPTSAGGDKRPNTKSAFGGKGAEYYPEHEFADGGLSPSPPDYRRRMMHLQAEETSTTPIYSPAISPPDSPSVGVDEHDDFNDWMLLGGSIKVGSQLNPPLPHPSDDIDSPRNNGSAHEVVRERERGRKQGVEVGPELGEAWGRPPSPSASRPHTPSIKAPTVTTISSFMEKPESNGNLQWRPWDGSGMDGEARRKSRLNEVREGPAGTSSAHQETDNKRFSFSSSFWSPRRREGDPRQVVQEAPGTLKDHKLYI